MLFSNANRDQVKAANPGAGMAEISTILGKQWRELSDEDKKQYVEAAAADKSRYATELAAWKQARPDEATAMAKQKRGRKTDKKAGPKRATTACKCIYRFLRWAAWLSQWFAVQTSRSWRRIERRQSKRILA